jgi:hypothetical protein
MLNTIKGDRGTGPIAVGNKYIYAKGDIIAKSCVDREVRNIKIQNIAKRDNKIVGAKEAVYTTSTTENKYYRNTTLRSYISGLSSSEVSKINSKILPCLSSSP